MPVNPALAGPQVPQAPNTVGRMNNPTAEIGRLLDELERLRQSTGQISLSPNQSDVDLIRRIQEATLTPALAQISGGFGSRGLSGSSLEASKRAQMAGQVGVAGAQQLQDLTFERAGFEMGRNKQLYDSLIGAITATTTPGAPGTQVQRKGGGFLGALGGVLGAAAGSVLGPVGTAIGGKIGNAILPGSYGGVRVDDNPNSRYG